MPQLQLPIFPAGVTEINSQIAVQKEAGRVFYLHGHLPVFQNEEQDVRSFRMALAADEGLALFAGLNVSPKKSYLSEYSSRVSHSQTTQLLAAWHDQVNPMGLFDGASFNLDFHSVPYYGEDPVVERHFVSAPSRRQPSILAFLAQDAAGRAFCYSNANLRKGEEAEEIFNFISFWKRTHGELPRHLVFDSRLTTYANLARLDQMGISFIISLSAESLPI